MTNTLSRFVTLLRAEFKTALQQKTGWGRNEVELVFEQSMLAAAGKLMDGLEASVKELEKQS